MPDTPQVAANAADVTDESEESTAPAARRSPGHRAMDVHETMAELTRRAHEISADANNKMASAMRDVIGAAAGFATFAVESARDLVQFMVRRGQMTQTEADRLIRDAEAAVAERTPRGTAKAEPRTTTPAESSASPAKEPGRRKSARSSAKTPAKATAKSGAAAGATKAAGKTKAKAPAKGAAKAAGKTAAKPAAAKAAKPAKGAAKPAKSSPAKSGGAKRPSSKKR